VGVAAYHAEDYAEAARELRAYRRMSGDVGYRAVLADCERALGRPDVALRLVAEALAESPDAEETVELHIVESGARLDLGEEAAARLVLEGALGGRPDPSSLDGADPATLRLASAFADLLQIQGEESLATEWFTAIAAADPEDLVGAVDRMGIEFFHDDEDDSDDEAQGTGDDSAEDDSDDEAQGAEDDADDSDQDPAAAPEVVESLPEDDHGLGRSFDEDVEAEVAELLGETDTSTPDAEPDSDQPVGHEQH
jgi:tetratricopeptide (TPR) repeat protein